MAPVWSSSPHHGSRTRLPVARDPEIWQQRKSVLRTCKKTCTYVFPRDAAERDLACTGESVVVLNSVSMDIKTWWQR
ncbi:hypothetical protein LAZ67_17002290 [Cordylochernes scorpioides]|uniref:Uncharacterized protein n=1 Tax=Cordylochernes scorpioides TaxID=51811 RepID=A0ABY6LDX1_9ARAC|nr:hypothetical protein LAZ67_17002290 [Cordylochernes scorpioides]